jgi:hypothetical protein
MPIAKWDMISGLNGGDDELWGDYMVRTTISPIIIKTTTPQYPVEVVLALVPIDDVGLGWQSATLFSSNVTLFDDQVSYALSGTTVHTIPGLTSTEYSSAFKSIASVINGSPVTRHFGLLGKWVLGGDVNGLHRPTQAQWAGVIEVCNGSGGWFAMVLIGRGLQVTNTGDPG